MALALYLLIGEFDVSVHVRRCSDLALGLIGNLNLIQVDSPGTKVCVVGHRHVPAWIIGLWVL